MPLVIFILRHYTRSFRGSRPLVVIERASRERLESIARKRPEKVGDLGDVPGPRRCGPVQILRQRLTVC